MKKITLLISSLFLCLLYNISFAQGNAVVKGIRAASKQKTIVQTVPGAVKYTPGMSLSLAPEAASALGTASSAGGSLASEQKTINNAAQKIKSASTDFWIWPYTQEKVQDAIKHMKNGGDKNVFSKMRFDILMYQTPEVNQALKTELLELLGYQNIYTNNYTPQSPKDRMEKQVEKLYSYWEEYGTKCNFFREVPFNRELHAVAEEYQTLHASLRSDEITDKIARLIFEATPNLYGRNPNYYFDLRDKTIAYRNKEHETFQRFIYTNNHVYFTPQNVVYVQDDAEIAKVQMQGFQNSKVFKTYTKFFKELEEGTIEKPSLLLMDVFVDDDMGASKAMAFITKKRQLDRANGIPMGEGLYDFPTAICAVDPIRQDNPAAAILSGVDYAAPAPTTNRYGELEHSSMTKPESTAALIIAMHPNGGYPIYESQKEIVKGANINKFPVSDHSAFPNEYAAFDTVEKIFLPKAKKIIKAGIKTPRDEKELIHALKKTAEFIQGQYNHFSSHNSYRKSFRLESFKKTKGYLTEYFEIYESLSPKLKEAVNANQIHRNLRFLGKPGEEGGDLDAYIKELQ